MQLKSVVMKTDEMHRSLTRMAHEIVEKNKDLDKIILLGIRKRGVPLANMIAGLLKNAVGIDIPVGIIDTSSYRDDIKKKSYAESSRPKGMPFNIDKMTVILVDDVLFTGRTIRAALDAVFDLGRPDKIQLAVLIDRGHRELPIRPDYVGRNIPTSKNEIVSVNIAEIDGSENVEIYSLID